MDPSSYLPPYDLGLIAYNQEDYEHALCYFQKSLSLKPEDTGVLFQKSLALMALNRRDEAIRPLEETLSYYDNPPENWKALLGKWQTEGK